MASLKVKLKNQAGDYLEPYTDNIPKDDTPTADSTNAVKSAGIKTALDNKADKSALNSKADKSALDAVIEKIPEAASAENQLADKSYVNQQAKKAGSHYRGAWATYADIPDTEAVDTYPADIDNNKTPLYNDYLVVIKDENAEHNGATWEYRYTGTWATNGKEGWKPIYEITKTPLTDAQLAALDSGITAALVKQINTNKSDIANRVVKNADITAGTHTKITYDAKGLVTAGANLTAADIPNLTLSKITDVTATADELNYLKGVTSAVQTQLNSKLSTATAESTYAKKADIATAVFYEEQE